ncbi:MAG: tetratricopeptide repeat protein [Planctomycetaceae bacterium]|nr:tetratricopeptide repeat protein [Planctomycetaceae bacterium]
MRFSIFPDNRAGVARRSRHGAAWRPQRFRAFVGIVALLTICVTGWFVFLYEPPIRVERILSAYQPGMEAGALTIQYPFDGALFPPEIVAPTFRWEDPHPKSDLWVIALDFTDGSPRMSFPSHSPQWTPADDVWQTIKLQSCEKPATATIVGVDRRRQGKVLSAAQITLTTSADEVGAPIFYREVALPFREAVLDPARFIRWRFGPISSKERPPVVLDNLPVCGNCHSFSSDGKTLAMEVDSGNDKASYTVAPIEREIIIDDSKLITWADYQREDKQLTFGLLCQVSPDGRHLVGTVKDRALAVYRENIMFSQLFFLVKGFLAIYDRERQEFHALPGADDPQYVQTNGVWSPDGKDIVFARSRDPALDPPELRDIKTVMVPPWAAEDFISKGKTFLYDLYRVPFNAGKGGQAVPIPGASNNGYSNYFPKFSPDGKWIVFCRARSFMLLQPDSELYIIPAEGGEARRLACNTPRMNSWHSWSPNGKWLVFSSKMNSAYTQLFLTHIDEQGNSSPPVVLSQFTAPDRAANIPEFVNAAPDAIARIRERFLNDESYVDIGGGCAYFGNYDQAIYWFRKALSINPVSAPAYENWGAALARQRRLVEAQEKLVTALELDPNRATGHSELAWVLRSLGEIPEALSHYREAVRLEPENAKWHFQLGSFLVDIGQFQEGQANLTRAVELDPQDAMTYAVLGSALVRLEETDHAVAVLRQALDCDPKCVSALLQLASLLSKHGTQDAADEAATLIDRAAELSPPSDAAAQLALATVYEQLGRPADALAAARLALRVARQAGNRRLIDAVQDRLASLEASDL